MSHTRNIHDEDTRPTCKYAVSSAYTRECRLLETNLAKYDLFTDEDVERHGIKRYIHPKLHYTCVRYWYMVYQLFKGEITIDNTPLYGNWVFPKPFVHFAFIDRHTGRDVCIVFDFDKDTYWPILHAYSKEGSVDISRCLTYNVRLIDPTVRRLVQLRPNGYIASECTTSTVVPKDEEHPTNEEIAQMKQFYDVCPYEIAEEFRDYINKIAHINRESQDISMAKILIWASAFLWLPDLQNN